MALADDRNAQKTGAALVSIAASGGLTVAKLAAGLASGSLSLLAEALHSLLDFGDGLDHASLAAERAVGKGHDARIGRRGRRGGAERARDVALRALRPEQAGRREGGGRGAADPGIAMDHDRLPLRPAAHEVEQHFDVLLTRVAQALGRIADVVHADEEVILARDGRRGRDGRAAVEQAHEMAGVYGRDRGRDLRQRADMDQHARFRSSDAQERAASSALKRAR